MKYLISIYLLLAVGQTSFAQNCTPLQDTITICGFEYDLQLRSDNGTLTPICPTTDSHIALRLEDSLVHVTVTNCGSYELTHTYQNTLENCLVEDVYILQMDDPSNQSINIISDLTVAYAPQPVHQGADASCASPDPTTVGIEGVPVPEIVWEGCNDFSSQTTIYSGTVFAPNPATDCEVDSIQININTQFGMSNIASCDGFLQSDFYNVAGVDFLDLVNSLGNTELGAWLANEIDVPSSDCGLNIDDSISIDTVIQSYTLDIPVRTGGNWAIIQNGTTSLLEDTTNLTLGGDDDYYLFIEPSADYIGPDSLFFQLLYGEDVDDLDSIPESQTLTLQWIEFWDTITVMTIDTVYNTTQYGCGGLSIASQSLSIPGAPASPFGPIDVGFPNCDCPNPSPTEYFFEFIDCFNPCVVASNGDVFCAGGTYDVIITDEQTGCTSLEVYEIDEDFNAPFVVVDVSGNINCDNPCVTLEAFSEPWFYYEWFTPNGEFINDPIITVCEGGIYEVFVYGDNGCISYETVFVIEEDTTPDIQIIGNTVLDCNNPCTTLYVEGIDPNDNSYLGCTWSSNGGFNDNTFTEITVCEAGIYTVEAQFVNGCVSESTIEVTEDFAIPIIDTNFPDVITCDQPCVTIEAFSDAPPNCYWIDETGQIFGQLMTAEVCSPGVYTVFVEGANGCQAEASVMVMENITSPSITIIGGGTITCAEPCVTISAMTDVEPTCVWTGADGTLTEGQTIDVCEPGIYSVTVTDPENGCTATESITIDAAIDIPQATIIGNPIFCEGEETELTVDTDAVNPTFQWNTGETTPTIFVGYNGTCSVVVTDQNGCTAVAEIQLIEVPIPDPLAVGNTEICTGATTTISVVDQNGGELEGCIWSDGSFGNTIQISEAGTYCVDAFNQFGCAASTCVTITIADQPTPIITGNTILCEGESSTLTVDGDYTNYSWSTGETTSEITVTTTDNYTVTVTSMNGCTGEDLITVDVEPLPIIDMEKLLTLECNIDVVSPVFYSNTDNLTFEWIGVDAFYSTDMIPVFAEAGMYDLIVTSLNGCTNHASVEVLDNRQYPVISATADTLDCDDGIVFVQGTSDIPNSSFVWTGPDDYINFDSIAVVSDAGTYLLTVTAPNGCFDTVSVEVIADIQVINLAVNAETINCIQPNVFIQATEIENATYDWTGPNAFTSTDINPMVNEAGMYHLTVNYGNNCSTSTNIEVLADTEIPDIFVPSATLTCQMENLVLEPESTIENLAYNWTNNNGFSSTDSNPTIENVGIYNLEIQNLDNGCTNTTSVEIDAIEPINVDFITESTCGSSSEGNINLNQISGGVPPYSINWLSTNATDFNLSNLTIGNYEYEINDSGDCVEQGSVAIESAPTNLTVTQESMDICEGSTMLLNPLESYEMTENTIVEWQNGSNNTSLMIDEAGTYQVSIQEDCDVFEHVYEVTEKEDYSNRVYIPNAFSPNGDGVNDEFLPLANSEMHNYTLSVFDRWGNLLFQNKDTEIGWKGMNANNNELETGVFIYHLRADVQNCEGEIVPMEKYGDVTLLK